MEYSLTYFINKFEAIPEELWATGDYGVHQVHCALGHCGVTDLTFNLEEEATSLNWLLKGDTVDINDGHNIDYQQPTPKQRILAALYDIKANEAVREVQELVNQNQSIEQKAEVETIVK